MTNNTKANAVHHLQGIYKNNTVTNSKGILDKLIKFGMLIVRNIVVNTRTYRRIYNNLPSLVNCFNTQKSRIYMSIAIYPGSFDPVTNGHLDVLKRACELFDKVIVAIATSGKKQPIFTKEQRLQLIQDNIQNIKNSEIVAFDGLTVDFAEEKGADAIIRGLRAVSDFEYEFQMAQMNRQLNQKVETIFLMPNQDYFYTSSQLIKSVSQFSAERVAPFVPQNVLNSLLDYFKS